MLSITDIHLAGLVTHFVGNGSAGDMLQLSRKPVVIENAGVRQILLQYFLSPFKEVASYNLWLPAGWLDAGWHKLNMNVSAWPSGMYFVNLIAGDSREVIKLSVVH